AGLALRPPLATGTHRGAGDRAFRLNPAGMDGHGRTGPGGHRPDGGGPAGARRVLRGQRLVRRAVRDDITVADLMACYQDSCSPCTPPTTTERPPQRTLAVLCDGLQVTHRATRPTSSSP